MRVADDLKASSTVTRAQWQNRPLRKKVMEHVARLRSSQL
jgi:hypothetical protein